MSLDLTDLGGGPAAAGSKKAASDEKPANPQRGPKSYDVAVIQFWDRYTCRCGAEHEGPRAGYHPAYFKHWNGQRAGYEFRPVGPGDTIPPTLPREISLQEVSIPCCPWCHPAFDGYPSADPEYSTEEELSQAMDTPPAEPEGNSQKEEDPDDGEDHLPDPTTDPIPSLQELRPDD